MNAGRFLLLVSLLGSAVLCDATALQTRFSVGPAWHHFFSYEVYQLTQAGIADELPFAEVLENELSLMPYIEGRVRGYWGTHCNLQVFGAGGIAGRARGTVGRFFPVAESVGLRGTNDTFCVVKLALFDVQCGYEFGSELYGMYINPLVGYVLNNERVNFTLMASTNTYDIKNIWKGPYVGCELTWAIMPSVTLKPLYKCIIGHISSYLKTELSGAPTFGGTPDAPRSWRAAPMLGNLFSVEAAYCHRDAWKLGTAVTYWQYKNRKPARVTFGPGNQQFVSAAQVERLLWEQIIWNCFFEWDF